jgi:PadR family transcriptional regulator PadR
MSTEDRLALLQGTLDLLILRTLNLGPAHGHAIAKAIEHSSDDVLLIEEGSLYPALHRLEEAGWVKAEWMMTANKRRARVYEVTDAGRQQLEAQETRWRTVTLAVSHVLDRV